MNYSFESPLGDITYGWYDGICQHVHLGKKGDSCDHNPVSQWLKAYFQHNTTSPPPLAAPATPFQANLRLALFAIPKGSTQTYGALAKQLNTSPRGLGQALGANPFLIIVPCHRILAVKGLGGFSGGLAWKENLLAFERS